MTTSAITGSPTIASTTSDAAKSKLSENFDSFLTLLTTQLKHQDPLSPMDSTQFVQQLVQFTQVEQAIGTNKHLEELLEMQQVDQITGGMAYIGSTVEYEGATAPLQDGSAEYAYVLESQGPTTIVIADANGNAVYTGPGAATIGKHEFVWDGRMSNGAEAPAGAYTIHLRNAENKVLEVATAGVGKVTSLQAGTDGLSLILDGVPVSVSKVFAVRSPALSS